MLSDIRFNFGEARGNGMSEMRSAKDLVYPKTYSEKIKVVVSVLQRRDTRAMCKTRMCFLGEGEWSLRYITLLGFSFGSFGLFYLFMCKFEI